MARTNVSPVALTPGAMKARPAGTTIDATLVTNGVRIPLSEETPEEIIVEVTQTAASSQDVTIQSGANPPAWMAGRGDIVGTLAQNEVGLFGPFESAQVVQADGSIWVDFEAGTTGTLRVYHVPR